MDEVHVPASQPFPGMNLQRRRKHRGANEAVVARHTGSATVFRHRHSTSMNHTTRWRVNAHTRTLRGLNMDHISSVHTVVLISLHV
jgi:hypothetical protein